MSYLCKDSTSIVSCSSCNSPFNEDDNVKNGNYFIFIPLLQQIKTLLSNTKLFSHLTDRNLEFSVKSNTVKDVTTSALYKEIIAKHGHVELAGLQITSFWNAWNFCLKFQSG